MQRKIEEQWISALIKLFIMNRPHDSKHLMHGKDKEVSAIKSILSINCDNNIKIIQKNFIAFLKDYETLLNIAAKKKGDLGVYYSIRQALFETAFESMTDWTITDNALYTDIALWMITDEHFYMGDPDYASNVLSFTQNHLDQLLPLLSTKGLNLQPGMAQHILNLSCINQTDINFLKLIADNEFCNLTHPEPGSIVPEIRQQLNSIFKDSCTKGLVAYAAAMLKTKRIINPEIGLPPTLISNNYDLLKLILSDPRTNTSNPYTQYRSLFYHENIYPQNKHELILWLMNPDDILDRDLTLAPDELLMKVLDCLKLLLMHPKSCLTVGQLLKYKSDYLPQFYHDEVKEILEQCILAKGPLATETASNDQEEDGPKCCL